MQVLGCVALLAALGVLAHFVGEALPRRWFDPARAPFRPFAWEREGRFYERLGIRAWKDNLPDMSHVMPDMTPKSLARVPDPARLAVETCVAGAVHAALILQGLWCLEVCPGWRGAVIYGLWTLGNLPYILIQRYNRPRLLRLAARMAARPAEAAEAKERLDTI